MVSHTVILFMVYPYVIMYTFTYIYIYTVYPIEQLPNMYIHIYIYVCDLGSIEKTRIEIQTV